MKKRMEALLPTGIVTKITYVGNKLSTCFCVKDVNEFKHNHDIIYQGRCPGTGCNDHYLGETGRTISEEVLDHAGRDPNSYLFKHFVESEDSIVDMNNYEITEKENKKMLENGKLLKRF